MSAFVPTNVISITDGQIFLESDLFNANFRPAINAGLSVSRVGGAAQTEIVKKLGGGVRLALAQFRELAAFAQFASDLDETTRRQLERGQRIMEVLKQPQYSPLSVAHQAVTLYTVDRGFMDDVELERVGDFTSALMSYMDSSRSGLVNRSTPIRSGTTGWRTSSRTRSRTSRRTTPGRPPTTVEDEASERHMAGAKEIRTKIKSVHNTQKITRAMEMVAASKMRKAQER